MKYGISKTMNMSALMVGTHEQRVQKCVRNFTGKSGD
jgi:hypothetical protein